MLIHILGVVMNALFAVALIIAILFVAACFIDILVRLIYSMYSSKEAK
jgi:hypothetical protein